MNCSPPGSSVYGILQARTLGWIAIPFSRGSSLPRDWTWVSHIAGRFFTVWTTREVHHLRQNQFARNWQMVQDRPGSALPGTRNSRSGTYQAFSRYSIKFAEGINLISLGILKCILLLVEQMFSYILKQHVRGGRVLILELKTYYIFQYWLCLSYP